MEIDRHILEEMKDPLIHLVRNCIDHGIEQPAARLGQRQASARNDHLGMLAEGQRHGRDTCGR